MPASLPEQLSQQAVVLLRLRLTVTSRNDRGIPGARAAGMLFRLALSNPEPPCNSLALVNRSRSPG
jgi:hypothetical protein